MPFAESDPAPSPPSLRSPLSSSLGASWLADVLSASMGCGASCGADESSADPLEAGTASEASKGQLMSVRVQSSARQRLRAAGVAVLATKALHEDGIRAALHRRRSSIGSHDSTPSAGASGPTMRLRRASLTVLAASMLNTVRRRVFSPGPSASEPPAVRAELQELIGTGEQAMADSCSTQVAQSADDRLAALLRAGTFVRTHVCTLSLCRRTSLFRPFLTAMLTLGLAKKRWHVHTPGRILALQSAKHSCGWIALSVGPIL